MRFAIQAPVWLSLGWSLHVWWTWGRQYAPAALPVTLLAHGLALLGIVSKDPRPLRPLAASILVLLFALHAGYYFGLALVPSMILLWFSGLWLSSEAVQSQKRKSRFVGALAAVLFGLYIGGYLRLANTSRPHLESARRASAVLKVRGNLVK